MDTTLGSSVFSDPLHTIVFLVLALGAGIVLWLPLTLSRRFRNLRSAAIVAGSVAGLLTLLMAGAPGKRRTLPASASASTPAETTGPGVQAPRPAPDGAGDPLDNALTDEGAGFSIRFPRGWSVARIDGKPWSIEADGPDGARISAGAQTMAGRPRPAPETRSAIETHLRAQPDTTFHAGGEDRLQGHPYVWFKYTGPMPTTTGPVRMTMVHYIVPLEGRALEVRMAAPPESFKSLEPLMSKSIGSFAITSEVGKTDHPAGAPR